MKNIIIIALLTAAPMTASAATSFTGSASPSYIEGSSAPVTGTPLTMACWFRPNTSVSSMAMITLSQAVSGFRFLLYAETSNRVAAQTADGSTAQSSISTGGVSVGTWAHAAGVWVSATSRTSYLNGVASTINTATVNPSGTIERLQMGTRRHSGLGAFFNGSLANCAVWNVALTQAEITILARGYSPTYVRPGNLAFYAPLTRNIQDIRGGIVLTPANTTATSSPRIYGY